MTDHADLRDRLEALLKDASNIDWSTAELDDCIRLAMAELSGALPVQAVTTIEAVDETYEYDLSSLSGLVAVVEVWYPYSSEEYEYRLPHPVQWRMLHGSTLYLNVDETPDAAYDLRVFYDKAQTLSGLDGATSTSLDAEMKAVVILGAAGYAANALGRHKVDAVTFGNAAGELRKWGWARLQEFRARLSAMSERLNGADDARIGWWPADKWDL